MKQIFKIFTLIIFIYPYTKINAQSCSDYYPMTKGIEYEITKYDKKNKVESITYNTITSFQKQGETEVATVQTVVTDSNGKETLNSKYTISCNGDGVTIDTNTLLKEKMASTQTSSNIESEVTGVNPFTPNGLSIGQGLPDSSMKMDIHSGNIDMSFGADVTDKKVVGKEEVTVPAGTFECFVITQASKVKTLLTKHTTSKIWLAEGVGVVKQEIYNKKGQLESHDILTKFKK